MPKYLNLRLVSVAVLLLLSPIFLSSVKTNEPPREQDDNSKDRWEYLVVGAPNRTNFSPTGNARMRKEEMGGFGIEAFVLEQHMDKVGANGWELVAVQGNPDNPIFYFKRLKTRRD